MGKRHVKECSMIKWILTDAWKEEHAHRSGDGISQRKKNLSQITCSVTCFKGSMQIMRMQKHLHLRNTAVALKVYINLNRSSAAENFEMSKRITSSSLL